VDPRAGLDDVEKRKFLSLSGLEPRPLDRSARSQSLHRLRYPSSFIYEVFKNSPLVVTIPSCREQLQSIWTPEPSLFKLRRKSIKSYGTTRQA
jgi:hypothetical protein